MERGQLTLSPRPSPTTLVDTTVEVAGMARGLPMLNQKPSHTGLITEDTGMERGQLTQSQRLSPTTLVDTATAAIMARGLLMLSQKLSPTGLITEDTGTERGLLMPSQKQSLKLSLTTGAILTAGLTGDKS